jgi:hypothetical protein
MLPIVANWMKSTVNNDWRRNHGIQLRNFPSPGRSWRLRLLEDSEEVGGGVFPPVAGIEDEKAALQAALDDTEDEAYAWLDSRTLTT